MKQIYLFIILSLCTTVLSAQLDYQVLQNIDLPTEAYFGSAVTVSENYLAVAATRYDERGQIYIYKNGQDNYELMQILSPDIATESELFGSHLDMTDDHLVIGSKGGAFESGKAYIFERQDEDWVLQKSLNSDENFNLYGGIVKIDQERIIISAQSQSSSIPFTSGMVEVYDLIDDEWIMTQTLLSPIAHCTNFGMGVDIKGEWLAITGINKEADFYSDQRRMAAFLYRFENGEWTFKQDLYLDFFNSLGNHSSPNHNVAISKDQLIVSNWLKSGMANDDGLAEQPPVVFYLEEDHWIKTNSISEDHYPDGNLGRNLALNDNFALIGVSENYLGTTYGNPNAILVYDTQDPNNWQLVSDINFEASGILQNFGFSFDTSDSYGVASSQHQPFQHGEVYIFNFKDFVDTANLIAEEDINIYPIPSSDFLNVEYQKSLIIEYTIFSPSGQIMASSNQLKTNRLDINISNLSQGNYWVKVITEDGYLYKQISKI